MVAILPVCEDRAQLESCGCCGSWSMATGHITLWILSALGRYRLGQKYEFRWTYIVDEGYEDICRAADNFQG